MYSAKNRCILILIKAPLDRAVPIIGIARHLAARGHRVELVCGSCSDSLHTLLDSEGIDVISLALKPLHQGPLVVRKLREWLQFRLRARVQLRQRGPDLIYIGGADTAIALAGLMTDVPYVLHLRELHDQERLYMRALGPIARRARRVVVPEVNRAFIYASLFRLPQRPLVLPNKPFSHPRQRRMDVSFLPQEIQKCLTSHKVLLYQGPIHSERDLQPLLRAIRTVQGYTLAVMGTDYGLLASYQKILPSLIHIPFVSPPMHLNVTSWAHIGLISYDTKSLNTIYCAPNKIWEYSGFGLPMLCSENPGLRYTVKEAGAAELVDLDSPDAIFSAIGCIEANYETMSQRSTDFFESINLEDIIDQLLAEPA